MDEKKIVQEIVVQQDTGGPYPVYKKVKLFLWSDKTVTWEEIFYD